MWNSTMTKPCIAHLSQVMLLFSSFLIPSLLFLLLRAVLMNHSFDIVRFKTKKIQKETNKKKEMVLFQADLEASGYSVSSKVKNKCKRKRKNLTESCYCKHILKELCM